jgi:hypothetical protein
MSKEFFTLRRQGAKKAYESKHRISSLNLSGLAALREISTTQGKKVFTLRREGAKKTYEPKHRIPFRNLSGFASLREISASKGRPAEKPTISYQPLAMNYQLCPV